MCGERRVEKWRVERGENRNGEIKREGRVKRRGSVKRREEGGQAIPIHVIINRTQVAGLLKCTQ